ncbi:hypothetical protein ULO1_19600, partial [Carboxydocella sp. ULO1]
RCILWIRTAYHSGHGQNEAAVRTGPMCYASNGDRANPGEPGREDAEPGSLKMRIKVFYI